MVINLLLQATCRSNSMGLTTAAAGAMSARYLGALGDHQISQWPLINYVQNRGAARRGKRIKRAMENRLRAAKKRIAEAQNPKTKKNPKQTVKMDKSQFRFLTERQLDQTLPDLPLDNVFFTEKFRRKRFSIEECLELHRQTVHPDVLNQPDALVSATIELNLKMKIKKKRFIERIESTLCYPNIFKYELKSRKIVALCKDAADQDAARLAGATVVGGMEIVDQLKKNLLTHRDFDHVVCHNNFLVEFASVKGMKGASFFPNKARGNFGDDMGALVKYFKDGIDYSLKKNLEEPEYGFIECYFGKLDMPNEQLIDNLRALFDSVNRFKPLTLDDNKQFFERVTITTPASTEMFLLKFWEIIDEYKDPRLLSIDQDEEEVDQKTEVTNT